MSRISLTFVALAAISASLPAPTAQAYCRMTVEEPMPQGACPEPGTWLEWKRQCISYSLVESEEIEFEEFRDAADRSFRAWKDVECDSGPIPLELAQTSDPSLCTEAQYNQRAGNTNSIFFLAEWGAPLPPDAFGLTMIRHSPEDGEIFDADMQLNATQGRFDVCGARCPPGTVDVENVITHEAGHFLGLGHSQVSDATMHERATIGETSKRSLDGDDVQGLCAIYGDLPAPECEIGDFQPNLGFRAECSDPEEPLRRTACACHAPGGRSGGAAGSTAWPLLLGLLVWLGARQRRRRPDRSRR